MHFVVDIRVYRKLTFPPSDDADLSVVNVYQSAAIILVYQTGQLFVKRHPTNAMCINFTGIRFVYKASFDGQKTHIQQQDTAELSVCHFYSYT